MSFVTAAPEEVQAAARNLAGIRSLLAESSASAAGPTAGIVAAAEDQVSAQVAGLFGAFGQDYQVISAQAQAFHERFVNLLGAGAGAYLNTEIANAEQNLLNAVNGPVQGLLGQSSPATPTG
jgi:PE family